MTAFILWATLGALAAALCIALPLWRSRPDGAAPQVLLGALAFVLVLVAAAALYAAWGHGSWRAVTATATTATGGEGIERLLAAATSHPDDVQAWLELGGGYMRIQQWPLARRSFERADRLSQGRNAEALAGIAETRYFESGGEISAAEVELFERALQLNPRLPAALFYTGMAALNAGHLDVARARFVALRDLGPPPQITAALDKQIAAIDAEVARAQPDPATVIHVHVSLAPALSPQLPAGATLFVFVRAPEGGPPLAARRLGSALPQDVSLSARDSMIAGRTIKPGQPVTVMARLSASASPVAQAGDLQGAIKAVAGSKHSYQLVIDQRSP
jgi:cytochrome c-type biogenesis protein CcmH